jgi:hypothetical protein
MRVLATGVLPLLICAWTQAVDPVEAAMAEHTVPGLAVATLEACQVDTALSC